MLRISVITPVYNDFVAFVVLCRDLGMVAAKCRIRLSIIAIDDGSTEAPPALDHLEPGIENITVLRLTCNLGHQRAIAVGLATAALGCDYDAVIVMDCDGEDRPSDLFALVDAHRRTQTAVIVARRAKRSESLRFRLFYHLYKGIFAVCTGRRLDFGNFMLIPKPAVVRLSYMPEIWNHLAAAVLRSRVGVERVACDRGRRYSGRSSMNVASLLTHGLSAVSVFSDLVFVRLLMLASMTGGLALLVAVGAVAVRVTTDIAVPGWASNVVGISAMMLFQALTLSAVACLIMLGNRASAVFIPANHADQYICRAAGRYEGLEIVPLPREYSGSELGLFAEAAHWRAYWQQQVRPFLGCRVLEVGAGIGTVTRDLCCNDIEHWLALEPDPNMAEGLAQDLLGGRLPPVCEPRCGTIRNLAPAEQFDTALYIDVLEHIEDDREEVAQVCRHLVPGGHLIVLVPAHQALYTAFDAAIGHYRRYEMSRLLEVAAEDMEPQRVRYLDCVGLLASLGNGLVLRSAHPSRGQILLWDRWMVRMSRQLDMLLGYRLGKSALVVWQKSLI